MGSQHQVGLNEEFALQLRKSRAHQHLRSLNYALKRQLDDGAIFTGDIRVEGRPIKVEIRVTDWDFFALPTIRLLERPSWLQGQRSHLSPDDTLCYVRRDEVLVNPRNVEEIIDNCLHQATSVLSAIAKHKSPLIRDDEFFAHWMAQHRPCLTSHINNDSKPLSAIVLKRDAVEGAQYLFTQNYKAALNTCKESGWRHEDLEALIIQVELTSTPSFAKEEWPPQTFKAIYDWLKAISPSANSTLRKKLELRKAAAANKICVLISCPLATCRTVGKTDE